MLELCNWMDRRCWAALDEGRILEMVVWYTLLHTTLNLLPITILVEILRGLRRLCG
ncbi:MAG: hypothetical protein Q4G36_08360 [Paracoccus sp. (in: a-proteobacteria)]|nr:hypothetical protein [Paracoccus sp. (in: a-proteobacteria)]